MLLELDVELCQEARGAYDYERGRLDVLPEERRQLLRERLAQIVRDDHAEALDPLPALCAVQELRDVSRVRDALDAVVELAQQADGLLRAVLADAGRALEEEVVAGVGGRDGGVVEDGEVADAGQDEVLEDGGGRRGAADDEDARGLERGLARGGPQPVWLSVRRQ
jgi:hypothetical protein